MIQVHAGRHRKTNHRSIQRKGSSSDHCMINVQQKLAKLPKKELKNIIAQTKKLTPSPLAIITKLGQKQINLFEGGLVHVKILYEEISERLQLLAGAAEGISLTQ